MRSGFYRLYADSKYSDQSGQCFVDTLDQVKANMLLKCCILFPVFTVRIWLKGPVSS